MANQKIIAKVLVVHHIASAEGGLAQIVEQLFLLQVQTVPFGHPVAHYFKVGKAIDGVAEVVRIFRAITLAAHKAGGKNCHEC